MRQLQRGDQSNRVLLWEHYLRSLSQPTLQDTNFLLPSKDTIVKSARLMVSSFRSDS